MANSSKFREYLSESYEDLLFADGFDDAIMGVVERCGTTPVVCYDASRCVEILVERDGMSQTDAEEYFAFNVSGAYVGINTPMWLTTIDSLSPFLAEPDTDPETVVTDPDQKITT